MNQLLQDSFVWPGSSMTGGGRTMMPLDVVENPDDYIVYASMPGVRPDDVQITAQGDTLTIRGQTTSSINEPQRQQMPGQNQGQNQGQQMQGQQGQQGRQDIVQSQSPSQSQNYLVRERRQATYFRQVQLPTTVNADKATARFENGELIVTLPKAEEARPKQIRIGAGQPQQRTIGASGSTQSPSAQQRTIEPNMSPQTPPAQQQPPRSTYPGESHQ
jgi:HSP20 family protein